MRLECLCCGEQWYGEYDGETECPYCHNRYLKDIYIVEDEDE